MTGQIGPSGAIVTGGASGIGRAIAEDLAGTGHPVVVLDVADEVAATTRTVAPPVSALGIRCDITDPTAVAEAFATAADWLEQRDAALGILVNNAGISRDEGIRRLTDDAWRATLAVNLSGAVHCCREAARLMVPRRHGSIVNIASRAWLGWFGQTSYAGSKGGLVSVTRSLAIELARHRIRVNCVAPGLIDTPLLRAEPDEVRNRLLAAQPSGTIGAPGDVAVAVRYLAGARASRVTGQVLYVCGGKSLYAAPA
jgi:3-oxoacyl-[acyl-carrier protein] reductase